MDCGRYDCIFSFDYVPLLSYVADEKGILYYSWLYDCPQFTLFSDSVYNECNRIFCFDKEQRQRLLARGVKNAFYMPLAANTVKLDNMLGTNLENVSYKHEISFIGSLYNDNMYNQLQYLPQYLKGYLEGLLYSQLNIYGYNLFDEVLTTDIIEELDKYIQLDDDVDIKIPHKLFYENMLFVKLAQIEREQVLSKCAEYADVSLYTGSEADIVGVQVMPPVDYHRQLPYLYRNSKINLNITCRSITSGMPLRTLDIMASGGFLLSNFQPELAEFFIGGEDLVLYDSMQDLEDKISYYLEHEEERIAIAQNGHKKVREAFSYEKMLGEMFGKEYMNL